MIKFRDRTLSFALVIGLPGSLESAAVHRKRSRIPALRRERGHRKPPHCPDANRGQSGERGRPEQAVRHSGRGADDAHRKVDLLDGNFNERAVPPEATDDAKDMLRRGAFSKYGDGVDAIINAKTMTLRPAVATALK